MPVQAAVQQHERDCARSDRDQRRRQDRIKPDLDGGVPAGMTGSAKQDGGKDDGRHVSASARKPYVALGGAPKFSAKKASVRLQASSAAALL